MMAPRAEKKMGWATDDGGGSGMKFFLKFYFNMETRLYTVKRKSRTCIDFRFFTWGDYCKFCCVGIIADVDVYSLSTGSRPITG